MSSPSIPTNVRTQTPLFQLAALVIVVAGLKLASEIVVPFLLASFIAIVAGGPINWLERRRVPVWLAILLVLGILVGAFVVLGTLIGQSVNQFLAHIDIYQRNVSDLIRQALGLLQRLGITVDNSAIDSYLDPGAVLHMVGVTLKGFGGVLSNSFLILLTVIFILLEAASFPQKLQRTLRNPEDSLPHFQRFTETVNRYMAIKTVISLITGALVWLGLLLLGVDYALLWGVLTFLLNYVPNIGGLLAGVPPVLLAAIQLGPIAALIAAGGITLVHVLIGNVIEPRYMGHGLGLSSLVVFASLVFWGWVLGPVGMLLSVPLTITAKIALEVNPTTQWIAVLLGPELSDAAARS